MTIRPIKIFYCYAHEDDILRKQLASHLFPLRRLRDITGWYDRDIQAGTEWEQQSKERLDNADVILMLVSADFMASDYCYTVEMTRALERHKLGNAHVIPILLRPVVWERTPLGELSPLPSNRTPVTQWTNPDAAWLDIVQGISAIIRKLLPMQHLSHQDANILYAEQGPLSGKTVGEKYLLGELIGEGGFSQVYKAQHLLIQRKQAVKVLLERHFRKAEFRERFLREARTIASLDHSNIIHIDDFWVDTAQAYLVMPYISGGTLEDILETRQRFLVREQIISYLEDICTALDYSHKQGIAHLDLKPLNLLVRVDGRLLLSDFGLAHLMKDGAIAGGSSLRIGTPHYMAPEHIKGMPERRSDLFSLGVILYRMLVGRLPFDGLPYESVMLKNLMEWPPAPRQLNPELPQAVEDMLAKALSKLPEHRYQTANEFLLAFKHAVMPTTHVYVDQHPQSIKSPAPSRAQPSTLINSAPAASSFLNILPIEVLGERYELLEPIGRGGMATIYRGRDRRMEKTVAIKVLREVYSTDPKFVTRFQREAKAASALQHPNIVQVYDYGHTDGSYFIVMELVEGTDLRRYLKARGVMTMDRAIIIAHDVALGLAAAHRRGIVHRDVKPQNVLVGRDGSIKLTDFGIAMIYNSSQAERLTPIGTTLGDELYYAPEQAQGEIVNPAADIYALGIVMYEMLTGRTPFVGDTPVVVAMQHIQDIPVPPSQLNPVIPPALEEITLRCLEKVPEMRYRDGSVLARALELLGEEEMNDNGPNALPPRA